MAQDLTFCDNRQTGVFLVVLSLAPLATSRSVARPWPVPRVSVRRVVPSNSGRRARMRSASGGTKPREFCTPRCTAGLTESGSSRLLLLPQQQSAAAPIRRLMTSITAGGRHRAIDSSELRLTTDREGRQVGQHRSHIVAAVSSACLIASSSVRVSQGRIVSSLSPGRPRADVGLSAVWSDLSAVSTTDQVGVF